MYYLIVRVGKKLYYTTYDNYEEALRRSQAVIKCYNDSSFIICKDGETICEGYHKED